MRTITLTAFDRPHYLEQVLKTILCNNLGGWKIFVAVEPGDAQHSIRSVVDSVLGGKCDYQIILNNIRLGVKRNPFELLSYVFSIGSKINIYLEDDIIVSPDVTSLADWYASQDLTKLMCLNLMYGACGGNDHLSLPFPELIAKTRLFNSLGFVATREQWLKYFEPVWLSVEKGDNGWDWSIYRINFDGRYDVYTLQPLLARANHIGREGGTYCLPAFHDSIFSKLDINREKKYFEYKMWPATSRKP